MSYSFYNIGIMGASVLNNLTDLQMFKLRSSLKEEDYLFSLCIEGGVLISEDSTKNKPADMKLTFSKRKSKELPENVYFFLPLMYSCSA